MRRAGVPTFVYGAGGHGKVVAEALRGISGFRMSGFLDDDPGRIGSRWEGFPVRGGKALLASLPRNAAVALAIGDNRARAEAFRAARRAGLALPALVHPSAVIASSARLGDGTFVGPLALVHCSVLVGRACIINSGAVVEHDAELEDWAHVSPHATLGGGVRIGEGTHIGMAAVVLPLLSIGSWSTLGAGAVATRDLPDGVTATGIPARSMTRGSVHG